MKNGCYLRMWKNATILAWNGNGISISSHFFYDNIQYLMTETQVLLKFIRFFY